MSWFSDVLKSAAGSLVGGLPGAALGLGTSVIGSLVSNGMNRSNQALTQEWQEKMNLQQQEWQEGMWNKTNEYNNASNQMQRLMDAGINPNAAAAQIAGTNGSAQLAQQPQIPSGNPIPGVNMDLTGGASQGVAMQNSMAQARLVNAQAENMEIKNDYEGDILGATLTRIEEEIDNVRSSTDLNESQKDHIDNFLNEYYRAMQNKTNAEVRETNERVKVLSEQVIQLHEQNENLKQELQNLKAQQKEIEAHTGLLGQEAEESRKRTEGQEIQNQILGVEKQIKDNDKIMSDKDREFAEDTGINPQGPNGRDMLIYKTANNVANNITGKSKGERTGRLAGKASMQVAGKLHKAGYKYQSVPVTYNPPRRVKQPYTRGDKK